MMTFNKVIYSLLLINSSVEIQAAIWAEQAEQFEDKYRGVKSDDIILIMTSVLIKMYRGSICLSASSATKFYLNQDFDSVVAFRQRYAISNFSLTIYSLRLNKYIALIIIYCIHSV